MSRKAHQAEIIDHYEELGYEVRVDDNGHVEYRKSDGEWLEGRYVSEYRIADNGDVVLT